MKKSEQIILAALKLISEKGYESTSVQDIASYCGISKGSFYKHFSSKEDLLIEVFRFNHYQMLIHSKRIETQSQWTTKEKFIKVIAYEIEALYKNKDLFLLLHKVVPARENEKFQPVLKKTKKMMLQSHKEWILAVYGNRVENLVWDLVLILQGLMKELVVFLEESISSIDKEEAAENIINRLDIIIGYKGNVSPLLPNEVRKNYEEIELDKNEKTIQEEWQDSLLVVKEQIQNMRLSRRVRSEVTETLKLLEKESMSEAPRVFLMKALVSYLKERTGLTDSLSIIERTIEGNFYQNGKEGV